VLVSTLDLINITERSGYAYDKIIEIAINNPALKGGRKPSARINEIINGEVVAKLQFCNSNLLKMHVS
jgi:hypothetical protein